MGGVSSGPLAWRSWWLLEKVGPFWARQFSLCTSYSVIFWVLSTKARRPGLSLNDGWVYFGAMMSLLRGPYGEFCDKHGAETER